MLFLIFPALAEVAVCGFVANEATPGVDATDVPVDVVPVIRASLDCAGDRMPLQVTISAADGTVVHDESISMLGNDVLYFLTEVPAFEPDADYTWTIAPEGQAASELGFHTGTDVAATLSGAPTLSFPDPEGTWKAGETQVVAQLDATADPDGLGWIGVVSVDEPLRVLAARAISGEDVRMIDVALPAESAPHEVCLTPSQWDAAGRQTLGTEVCTDVTAAMCATAPGAASALGLIGALLAGLRRRR